MKTPKRPAKPSTKSSATHNKLLCFSPRTTDLKEFEVLAVAAKDAGFTHIHISDLAEITDYRGEDKDSPWCAWSTVLPSIFKLVTPPGLEDAFPADWVRRQMAFVKAKHKIVEKLGMRAAFWGCEPHWLSERVFRKHPEWRGSRCDNSLRTTGMFFAPNVYHPEVLAAYREGVKMLIRECPLLDHLGFVANDSGSGYPWTKRLYVNPNGPTGYLGRDIGDCVVNFFSTMRQGAADAGVDAHFFTACGGWFYDDEIHLIRKSLKPGIGIYGVAPEPLTAECSIGSCGSWGGSTWQPAPLIDKYPTPLSIVNGAASVRNFKAVRFESGGNSMDYFTAFKTAMAMPPVSNERTKMDILRAIAEAVYAPDVVDDVVDAWYIQDKAETMAGVASVDTFGGPLMMRWLVRPLVAHQEMLTEEERSYWEPYIYQSKPAHPEVYLDYLNQAGYRKANNWEEAGRICCAIDVVEATFKSAADKLLAAADKTANKKAAEKLRNDAYRLLAQRSLALTARHYLQMGTLIYVRDGYLKELEKRGETMTSTDHRDPPAMPKGDMGSHGLFFMHRAMRWELDNTNELIALIKKSPVPLFYTRTNKRDENPLYLGPGLIENLEKKVDITLKYWRTAEIGWYRPTLGG